MQALAAERLRSFREFPARQSPAAFNLDAIIAKLTSPTDSGQHCRPDGADGRFDGVGRGASALSRLTRMDQGDRCWDLEPDAWEAKRWSASS